MNGSLPQAFYRDNIVAVLEFVRTQYDDLLLAEEKHWIASVLALDDAPARLYSRLLLRRGELFRRDRLSWPDLSDVESAAQALCDCALLSTDLPTDNDVLLKAFNKAELRKRLQLDLPVNVKREALMHFIHEQVGESELRGLAESEHWLSLQGRVYFERCKLFFFGNRRQDMDEFVRAALGHLDYEPVTIEPGVRAFRHRKEFEQHWQYWDCRAAWEALDQNDAVALDVFERTLPEAEEQDFVLQRRLSRLRNRIARALERCNYPEQALELYQRSAEPPSLERQLLLLQRLERDTELQALCKWIDAQPVRDAEREAAERARVHLQRKRGETTKLRVFKPLTTRLTLKAGKANVETVAAEYYTRFGPCWHVENSLLRGVLGLFTWDIVFMPLRGAFFNPFQRRPTDFYHPAFRQRRAEAFDHRLHEMDDPLQFRARVWSNWESKQGRANPLVHWSALKPELLDLALQRIPTEHWRVCFERMLADLESNTSGIPDLVLFPRQGSYEFIEIKGPGDALQSHQRRWLAWFSEQRIPSRVVQVRWRSDTP